jgi:hypothetical protein
MKLLFCAMFFALTLSAANITGTWQGTASYIPVGGKRQTTGIYLKLTQSGTQLTGTASEPVGNKVIPDPIESGIVQGKAVSFVATINNVPVTFELNVVSTTLMNGKMTGGGKTSAIQVRLEKHP